MEIDELVHRRGGEIRLADDKRIEVGRLGTQNFLDAAGVDAVDSREGLE